MSEVRKIQIQDGKGNIYHPQTVSEQVLGLDDKLDNKADKTDVDSKLSLKADKEDVDSKLSLKADKTDMDSKLSLKADKADMDSKLSLKADKTDVDSKLSLKADKADMDSKLSLKADKTDVDSKLSLKADISELNNKADKSELTPINNDILRLEENKADMGEVNKELESRIPFLNWEDIQTKDIIVEPETWLSFELEGKGVLLHSVKTAGNLKIASIDDTRINSDEINGFLFIPFNKKLKLEGFRASGGKLGTLRYILL